MTLDAETKTILAEELDDIALELAMPPEESTSATDLFQQLYSETERLRDTAELYEFAELIPVATWVLTTITALKAQPERLEQQHEQGQYYAWIELLATLLREQDADTQAELFTELNAHFQQSSWSPAIEPTQLQALFSALSVVPLADLNLDFNTNQPSTYITWDDDVHPELLEAFLIETPDLVSEATALIRDISTGNANQDTRHHAARLAHTLKGSCAVVGVDTIADFAHQLEDVLEHSLEFTLPAAANECLLESADCLEALFESLQTQTEPPTNYTDLSKQLAAWDKKLQHGEITTAIEVAAEAEVEVEVETNIDQPIIPTWAADIHPELLAAYLSETPQHIQQLSQYLHDISTHQDNKTTQHNSYKKAAIAAHTIKGSSATVENQSMVDIAATLETIFDQLSAAPTSHTLNAQHNQLLTQSATLLEQSYAALLANNRLPDNYQPLLTQLNTWQQQLETIEEKSEDEGEAEAIESITPQAITPQKNNNAPHNDNDQTPEASQENSTHTHKALSFQLPPMRVIPPTTINTQKTHKPLPNQQPQRAVNETTLRVPVSLIEKLLNFSNELITSNTQIAAYAQTLLNDKRTMHNRNERIRNLVDELEWTISRQSNLHSQQQIQQAAREFDELEMENYHALQSISNLLAETTNDDHETSLALIKQFNLLKDHIAEQQKINKALNSNVLSMRMEPIAQINARLARIVRETCRQTNKKANFTLTGDDIALDIDVLKGLSDPLLHLLRNAVDHGIETPTQRQQNHKAETGNISLHVDQIGDQVTLTLKDDGAGMDAEAIYQKALSKGLVSPDDLLSDDEKLRLILQAGFSTRDKVSKVSGRGVGMDVVNTAVNELSGNLRLKSKQGVGSEIQIQVPITLVATNALLVEVADHILAIPSSAIEQIIYLEQGAVQHKQDKLYVRFEQHDIPLVSLAKLLDWSGSRFDDTHSQAIIIVQQHEAQYAFYFDQMMDFQEIVLKTLKPWMPKIQGVNGVCLLQNGVVAPVLNLTELLTAIPATAFAIETVQQNQATAQRTQSHQRSILVVDDSLSNRKALSLTIEPLGYEVTTAIDGADAIKQLEQTHFDLVITDLEMPNINGTQLTEYIRKQPDIQHLPIIMVTSRSTAKHRALAAKAGVTDYLTKPVKQPILKACLTTFFSHHETEQGIKL